MNKENSNASKYAEYSRKSTDDKEKQVLSLESQRGVLDRLKERQSLTISETIEEKMSAKYPGRPQFGRLIKLIKDGEIDGIVTWAPHRLARNSIDAGQIVDLLDKGLLKEIVTESYTFRNTPMDIFMFGFQCLQAKFENDNKALDVKAGMETCAQRGIYPGCPPLGYLPDQRGVKGARKRMIDPVNFPIMRKMWDLMLSGTHTPYQILKKAIDEWGLRTRTGKKPSNSTAYKIFHNPFYYGDFEYPKNSGNWYKGVHQPMITKAEFNRVQKMFAKPNNARPSVNYFPYGGCVLHCGECGCAISGTEKIKRQQNGNVHHYVYYGCSKRKGFCSQRPVTERELSQNIEQILNDIHMPEGIHDLLLDLINNERDQQVAGISAQNEANEKAYETTQKKIAGLIDMRASGLITDAEFQERRVDVDKEKLRLQNILQDAEHAIANWTDTAERLFKFAALASKSFQDGSPEQKREILLSLGWNLALIEKKLDLTGQNWIQPVKQIAKLIKSQIPALEPVLSIYHKGKIEKLLNSPEVCALLQEVRNALINNPEQSHFPAVKNLLNQSTDEDDATIKKQA